MWPVPEHQAAPLTTTHASPSFLDRERARRGRTGEAADQEASAAIAAVSLLASRMEPARPLRGGFASLAVDVADLNGTVAIGMLGRLSMKGRRHGLETLCEGTDESLQPPDPPETPAHAGVV